MAKAVQQTEPQQTPSAEHFLKLMIGDLAVKLAMVQSENAALQERLRVQTSEK